MTNMNVYWNDDYCAPQTQFDTLKKSALIAQGLRQHTEVSKWVTVKDPADTVGALARAHTAIANGVDAEYLQAVMTGRPRELAESNGFQWDAGIYQMALNSTAGIMCAVDDVVGGYDHACSLSSGLHHARRNKGGGFCTVNSLALGALYASKLTPSVAILDLDAHFGGGTNEYIKNTAIKQVDVSTADFDGYETDRKDHISVLCKKPEEYLDCVEYALETVAWWSPDILFYNAGVDVFPFVDAEIVYRREEMVASRIDRTHTKTVIVMAGGYGNYEIIIPMHLSTIMSFSTPHLTGSRR